MNINDTDYRDGSLVCVNLALGHGTTTRYAMVTFADGHGDARTLVDVTGKELTGDIVNIRHMTYGETLDWNGYGKDKET